MNQKMQWLRNTMSGLDLQGMIISNPVNIKYLTNINAEGILLVTRKENVFITDGRYIEDVHNTLTLFDEIPNIPISEQIVCRRIPKNTKFILEFVIFILIVGITLTIL